MRVFVTGASGRIGSAVVPELIGAGHQVVGLARSEASAAALVAAGAEVQRGTLDDLDRLRGAAAKSDGVIHLAFKHDIAFTGDFQGAADADRRAVETFGEALAGSDRPFLIASGVLGLLPGRVSSEQDGHGPDPAAPLPVGPATRAATAEFALSLASRGVGASVVRLPPTCHGDGDKGFMATLVEIARAKGVSGYLGDGSIRQVADVIGRHLDFPVTPIAPEDAGEHFGFLAHFVGADSPASSALTRQLLSWQPTHLGLIDDLDQGHSSRVRAWGRFVT
jgi:nucleoside-diphosphate-sugar epimerase